MRKTAVALLVMFVGMVPVSSWGGEVDAKESAAIERAALDYVDGYFAGSVERLEKALHPNLQKVTVRTLPNGRDLMDFNGASYNLIEYVRTGMTVKPEEERKITVTIYDVFDNIATVKIDSADFFDYAHVVKVNGEWKVINVLWAMKEKPSGKPAPKNEAPSE